MTAARVVIALLFISALLLLTSSLDVLSTPSVANSSLLLKKKNCQRSCFAVRSEKQCIKKCLSEKITKKNKIQSLSDSSMAIGASLQVVSKNPWEYEGVDIAVRKGPCGSHELATFVPVGGVVTYNGQFQKGCGATWVSVTTRRDGISGYIPSVFLREINPANGHGAMCKPVVHPKFSQCDKGWGYDKMSGEKTLCHGGCVVSAIASALALRKKKIGGADATPGTLNAWLKANKGYLKDDLVNFNALAPLGLKFDRFTKDENDIKTSLCAGDVVLLNVRFGKHWVLGEGVQGREYFVVDSSYAGNTYSFIDVEGAVILAKV